jgi:Lipase (class 3)/RoxA-like, cytochrome c-like
MKPLSVNKPSKLIPPVRRYRFVPELDYEYFEDSQRHPFEPNANDFRMVNAWWLIDAAMLAFSNRRIVEHWCLRAGFREVEWFSLDGTQCYIAAGETYIFVAFRGADPPKRFRNFLIDWNLNFKMGMVQFDKQPGCVHRGFLRALEKVSKPSSSEHGRDLLSRLRSFSEKYPGATVWFTGHSMGAALAALAAARYVHEGGRAQLYAFGSPRIGDRKFQESYGVPAWRLVNSTDIVTRLPLFGYYSRSAGLFKWPLFGAFHPVGELRFIDDNGEVRPHRVKIREPFSPLTYIQRKFRNFCRRFTNHAPLHYALHLSNAMVNEETHTFPVLSEGETVEWRWWQWAAVVAVLAIFLVSTVMTGIRCWMGHTRADPPAAIILENGLGSEREEFYSLAEGSEMFPLAVAQSLNLPKEEIEKLSLGQSSGFAEYLASWFQPSKIRLLDNLETFGFIKVPITPRNTLGYIGLTVNRREGTGIDMLGVNCAACHVGQMEYNGKVIRVDGAPNLLDVFGFVDALSQSVRLNRLSNINPFVLAKEAAVWGKELSVNGWSLYQQQLRQHKLMKANPKPLNGRADAFGTARAMFFGDFRELTSPASYPHIWGLEKTMWYHWNANTNSIIERNVGQALGLGAGLDPETCKTTIRFEALDRLERLASKLKAPEWPAEFGPIDKAQRDLGEKIYVGAKTYESRDRGGCVNCHDNYRTEMVSGVALNEYRLSSLNEVGTDPNEALTFVPGVMVKPDICKGNKGESEFTEFTTAHEVLLGNVRYDIAVDNVSDLRHYVNGGRAKPQWIARANCGSGNECPVYPAKPLIGIWATAPYLHNGSVPSIWDLLRPASKRPVTFNVGQRAYDPKNLGYEPLKAPDDKKHQVFDTTKNGNLNSGHEFGINLSDNEKRALIEFLKSLKEGDEEKLRKAVKPEKDN